MSEPCGLLLLDKPQGFTSMDAVNVVRRLYHTRQVGHAGTLDPLATGLLVVMVGRAVKLSGFLIASSKSYEAVLRLGVTTDTGDVTGKVLSEKKHSVSLAEIEAVLPSFRGNILQTPPMVSALKINGQKLVDLARKGKTVERSPRAITVEELTVSPLENGDYALRLRCSKGTYVRTLCEDIGEKLGCGGTMVSLRRTASGGYSVSDAHTPEEIAAFTDEERLSLLLPAEDLFASCPLVTLSPFFERLGRNGQKLNQKKIGINYPPETLVRLAGENGFFALGKIEQAEEGSVVRPVCQMDVSPSGGK